MPTEIIPSIPTIPQPVTPIQQDNLICPACGYKARVDRYGTLQTCQHFYGGVKNGRMYILKSLEEVLEHEKES